ncbi:hypothetical protein POL68_35305 [Stigmatella sp. ncwal1]|uniref:Lipoprotein n=1 Tax=Stigmatella ashevillensis TaxID=2995309 RepID=A0ABT5DKZ0_9BACT|nr:hypothetical protein [Stigmatella ashevillena]MDC0713788.1 hypothetical protein [Stigmatella ashevillena]
MRGIVGALLCAGLAVGCGGGVDDAPFPAEPRNEVTAALCGSQSVSFARYYTSNGVECGLSYHYCDGHVERSGCQTGTFTQEYYCGCP